MDNSFDDNDGGQWVLRPINGWSFQTSLQRLRSAFEASRRVFASTITEAENNFAKLREEQNLFDEETDKDRQNRRDYEMSLGDEIVAAEASLELVRESFTITLHHFWEKWVKSVGGSAVATEKGFYEPDRAIGFLKGKGLDPDARALQVLKLACEVAKHSEGSSADELWRIEPSLFRQPYRPDEFSPGYDDLRLTDFALDAFFATVQRSGPGWGPISL